MLSRRFLAEQIIAIFQNGRWGHPLLGSWRQCGDVLQVWPLHRGNLLECLPQRRLMATIAGQAVHAGQQKGRRKPFGSSS